MESFLPHFFLPSCPFLASSSSSYSRLSSRLFLLNTQTISYELLHRLAQILRLYFRREDEAIHPSPILKRGSNTGGPSGPTPNMDNLGSLEDNLLTLPKVLKQWTPGQWWEGLMQ